MSISIQNAEKMFSEDIVLNHFINLCIQKGFINKKFKHTNTHTEPQTQTVCDNIKSKYIT